MEERGIYKSMVHPLIAVFLPFFFIAAISYIITDSTGGTLYISSFQFLLFLLSGVIKVCFNLFLWKQRLNRIHMVREFIISMPLYYLLHSLLSDNWPINGFSPGFLNVFPIITQMIYWLMVNSLHYRFFHREQFLEAIKDREGPRLMDTLTRLQGLSVLVAEESRDMLSTLNKLLITVVILFLYCRLTGMIIRRLTIIWTGIFIAALFISRGLINLFHEEYTILGEGINFKKESQKKKISTALMVILLSLMLSTQFAGEVPLIKIPEIKLKAMEESIRPFQPVEEDIPDFDFDGWHPRDFQDDRERGNLKLDFPFWLMLLGAVVIFTFLPFFSPEFRKGWKRLHLLRFIKKKIFLFFSFFFRLIKGLGSLFHKPGKRMFHRKQAAGGPEEESPYLKKTKKRQERNLFLRWFRKLCRWGKKRGIFYYSSQTASDYFKDIEKEFPALKEKLTRVQEIFGEALFSDHPVSPDRKNTYLKLIREITRIS